MRNKDAFTDVVENLPKGSENSDNSQNKPKNQQVVNSDGEIVTLGVDEDIAKLAKLIIKLRKKK